MMAVGTGWRYLFSLSAVAGVAVGAIVVWDVVGEAALSWILSRIDLDAFR